MIGHTAAVLFALATTAASQDKEVSSLSHSQLHAGLKFEIQTADRVYRVQLLDRATGQCQLASSPDGATFESPHRVYLLGATAGPQDGQSLVLMREVKVGLKMELGLGDLEARNRQLTGEVKAIRIVR
jgi:hypothetical protein